MWRECWTRVHLKMWSMTSAAGIARPVIEVSGGLLSGIVSASYAGWFPKKE